MSHLLHAPRLYHLYALSGELENIADDLQCPWLAIVKTEPEDNHLPLERVQILQELIDFPAYVLLLERAHGVRLLGQVHRGQVVAPGDPLLRDGSHMVLLHGELDVLPAQARRGGDLLEARLAGEVAPQSFLRPGDRAYPSVHEAGEPDGTAKILIGALHSHTDVPPCER